MPYAEYTEQKVYVRRSPVSDAQDRRLHAGDNHLYPTGDNPTPTTPTSSAGEGRQARHGERERICRATATGAIRFVSRQGAPDKRSKDLLRILFRRSELLTTGRLLIRSQPRARSLE